jgi:hypothetical protein
MPNCRLVYPRWRLTTDEVPKSYPIRLLASYQSHKKQRASTRIGSSKSTTPSDPWKVYIKSATLFLWIGIIGGSSDDSLVGPAVQMLQLVGLPRVLVLARGRRRHTRTHWTHRVFSQHRNCAFLFSYPLKTKLKRTGYKPICSTCAHTWSSHILLDPLITPLAGRWGH